MPIRIGIASASSIAKHGSKRFIHYLETIEEQGWDSLWFSDRIVGNAWTMDPLSGMAIAISKTKRLKVGTGILLMSMRSPVTSARALSTIDQISEGRIAAIGVGVGQEAMLEYDAMGVNKYDRGKRLDDAIRLMRLLWSEDDIEYLSEFQKINGTSIHPKPINKSLPIWIGGRTEGALRRTGELGDGWLPTQVTPEDYKRSKAVIRGYAADTKRILDADHFGIQLGVYIVDKGNVPIDKVAPFLLHRRTDVSLEELNLLGTSDQISTKMHEYIDAGADKFVFNLACPIEEVDTQLEMLSKYIVQQFHSG